MFSIPQNFSSDSEGYITLPALKRFAKEKRNKDLKTTVDRSEIIAEIEKYAQNSPENEEDVLEWLDQVIVEGIKDVKIKYLNLDTLNNLIYNDDLLRIKLDSLLTKEGKRHLCSRYTEELKLFRYQIVSSSTFGKSIKLYLGKLICTYDKISSISSAISYPIFVEIYIDKGIIVTRAKSKSNMYDYSKEFNVETATTTTVDKQIESAVEMVCEWLELCILSDLSANPKFKKQLFEMVEKYTHTPAEISELIDSKSDEINSVVNAITNQICKLKPRYKEDVQSSIMNLIEKYFSITYLRKEIFTQDRDAYPLKLNATDEEDSRVEQTAAFEQPLQSKAIFFDNKKMLQKNKTCDNAVFKFKRKNPMYCSAWFKVKISINKDSCTIKFTEYTMEEDIVNVLFSLINSE